MKKIFSICLFIFCIACLSCIAADDNKVAPTVVVSIAPYKYFVSKIAGDTVKVLLLVPPGTSFHDFEPTPKQVLAVAKADIWFRIGETFEGHAIAALKNYHPNMHIVDLRDRVNLIVVGDAHVCHHCSRSGADLHIWLSPKEVARQVQQITEVLQSVYPENKELYRRNADQLLRELSQLDDEVRQMLAPLQGQTIMVAHPAYAYFARDYQLKQLPIEYEGKDPSPRQLDNLLKEARALHVDTIFVQREYGSKGAQLLANELKAKVVVLDPYANEDYFSSVRTIAQRIADSKK